MSGYRVGLVGAHRGPNLVSPFQAVDCPAAGPAAPREAFSGGHGTSEYYVIRSSIDALANERKPPIDVTRAMDFAVPGLCAQKSIESGGGWVDVPLFEW